MCYQVAISAVVIFLEKLCEHSSFVECCTLALATLLAGDRLRHFCCLLSISAGLIADLLACNHECFPAIHASRYAFITAKVLTALESPEWKLPVKVDSA